MSRSFIDCTNRHNVKTDSKKKLSFSCLVAAALVVVLVAIVAIVLVI